MKNFIAGCSVILLLIASPFIFNKIAGPTVECRRDGVVEVNGYYNNELLAIDPKTKEEIRLLFVDTTGRVFYDQPKGKGRYATWKENNLVKWDLEFHMEEK